MRCYFNLVETIVDSEGVEVADPNEARGLALEAIAEMIQDNGGEITDWRGWRLEAVDASGAILFTISLDALFRRPLWAIALGFYLLQHVADVVPYTCML
jgi:hypothetical protein